jgi:biofilm PGA synthesis N-glycosyltransferase PgaC
MKAFEIILLISAFILFYSYIGYGMVIWIMSRLKHGRRLSELASEDLPEITHVIAAFNEEDVIEDKINNCYMIDYPYHKIKTIIVADGSSDQTIEIIKKHPRIQLYYSPERKGKLHAVDRVMKDVTSPITVFSDANAMINPTGFRDMMKHFQSNRVGAVAGEKVVINEDKEDAAGAGEGIYWRYESALKQFDYNVHSVVGAAGELFAIRTHLFETPSPDTLIEDFVITLNVARQGYKVAYESKAQAKEYASASVQEEMKRKVRISAGGLQAVWRLRTLLNPFKHGILTFQYVSHRVLRWTLAPLSILLFFVSTIFLAKDGILAYQILLALQVLFYLTALAGYYAETYKIHFKAFFIPFYFMVMNVSVYLGLAKLVSGDYQVTWDKAKRR